MRHKINAYKKHHLIIFTNLLLIYKKTYRFLISNKHFTHSSNHILMSTHDSFHFKYYFLQKNIHTTFSRYPCGVIKHRAHTHIRFRTIWKSLFYSSPPISKGRCLLLAMARPHSLPPRYLWPRHKSLSKQEYNRCLSRVNDCSWSSWPGYTLFMTRLHIVKFT